MLKEVVFKGFKSFADQQTIILNSGINGIIGPNGCGKSNLIDGISFVLGAQSAKNLRGGKMTDLIFSGTAKAKGKESAEVTLVMDNSSGIFKKKDAETISVTRKLHKNGTSEYFIDGVPSRLRDVQDLFMDTGVGSDSYSIIGQNQVNKILSTKLDERRSIFEEASGIVKLRQQKEKTEKNLKDADVNIVRIDDIVVEIERQLKPLERQAKKAEEFKVFDDELSSLEMQYLLHEYHELNDVVSKNKERADSLVSLIDEKSSFLQSTEEKIDSLKESYQHKNDKLFDVQSSLTTVKEKIEKQKGAISLIEEKISNSQKNIIDYDKRLNEVENEHIVSAEDFKNKQKRIQEISKELLSLDEEMIEVEQTLIDLEVQKTTSSIDLDSRKQKLVDLMNKLNKKTVEREQALTNVQETKDKQQQILLKNDSFSHDKEQLEQTFIETKLVFDEQKSKIESLDKIVFNESNQLNSLSERKNVLSNELSTINSTIYQTSNKINSINSFIENNEGFYDGVKAILNEKKKDRFSGVIGAVGELLKVENDYEVAYETLLQGSMQHLITIDDSVAKEAVAFLKNNHKGRATFLPLTMAKPYTFDKNELDVISKTKGIHSALDFVSFDSKIQPVIHSLLGRSVIADNLDTAVDFTKKSGIRCRVSTIDGDLVQTNSISGGGNKNKKSSILSKQNELETLNNELIALQEKQNTITLELEEVKATIEQVINSSKENNLFLNELRLTFTTAQSEFETAKLNLDIFNEKTKDIQLEERELSIKLSSYEKHLALLKIEIEDTEKDIHSIQTSMSHSEGSSTELFDSFEEKREEKTQLLLKINSLKEESKQLNSFMDEIGNDSSSLEDKIGKLYRLKQDELTNIEKFNDDKDFEQKELLKFERESLSITADVDSLKQECNEINQQISTLENDIKFDRDEKEQYTKELNKINILLSKKETELKNNLLRLKEAYNITAENIDAFELLEIDYEKSRKRIGELKKLIANLGNVNVEAIEEYRSLKERYLDEKGQLDDIKNAKKDLKTLLEKVEEDMTNRFTTTFNQIASIFTTTYKELFEGGTAKLFLENPDKPLESAIEIIAQPPGKKPESLSLLSGGEKAFTAVALIFAIISAKPSPFVILDEVDAPLDEINVFRFAKQLARYKDKSQFIVITHRKGTMMATDSITGITQKEKGISIVFPYSIEERSKLIDKAAN